MTHDYKRYGTTTLFAGLNTLDGSVISTCIQRHRHSEWLKCLALIDRTVDEKLEIHVIADNYATHKQQKCSDGSSATRVFTWILHPRGSAWLDMVERFFRDITTQAIRRGVLRSIDEAYIAEHNR